MVMAEIGQRREQSRTELGVRMQTLAILIQLYEFLRQQVLCVRLVLTVPVRKTVQRALPASDQAVERCRLTLLQRKESLLIVCGVSGHKARGGRLSSTVLPRVVRPT